MNKPMQRKIRMTRAHDIQQLKSTLREIYGPGTLTKYKKTPAAIRIEYMRDAPGCVDESSVMRQIEELVTSILSPAEIVVLKNAMERVRSQYANNGDNAWGIKPRAKKGDPDGSDKV